MEQLCYDDDDDSSSTTVEMMTEVVSPASSIILDHVAVYLDRSMFNQVSMLNRDYYHQTSSNDGSLSSNTSRPKNNDAKMMKELDDVKHHPSHPPPTHQPYLIRPWPSKRRFRVGSRAWSVAFSYDGRTLACGTDNGTVKIWYCANGQHVTLNTIATTTTPTSPGNNSLNRRRRGVSGSGSRFGMSGNTTTATGGCRINCVTYYPCSSLTLLAAANDNGKIYVWKEGATTTTTSWDQQQEVRADGSSSSSTTSNNKNSSSSQDEWHSVAILQAPGSVSCIAFVPSPDDNTRTTTTVDQQNYYYRHPCGDQGGGKLLTTLLAAACPIDRSIRLFIMETETCVVRLPCVGPIQSLAILPNGQGLVSGGVGRDDQRLLLWDLSPSLFSTAATTNINNVTTTPTTTTTTTVPTNFSTSPTTAVTDDTPLLTVEDAIGNGLCSALYEEPASSQEGSDIRSIAISSRSHWVAFACGTRIGLYDFSRNQNFNKHNNRNNDTSNNNNMTSCHDYNPCRFLKGHSSTVRTVSLSPDDEILASACSSGTIRLWRVQDGLCLKKWLGHYDFLVCSLAFPPINQCSSRSLLSAGSDGTIALWTTTI